MSTSGAGRGRGWLNLKQSASESNGAPAPGLPVDKQNETHQQDSEQFQDVNTNLIAPAHDELIERVKCLSLVDDGILLNQKLRYIVEYWTDKCQTAEDVENSFKELYDSSLKDSDLATKMVLMASSQTTNGMVYHDTKIRNLFINRMQKEFEHCKQIAKMDRASFRNSVQMLGEYYNKTKSPMATPYKIFCKPLLTYLDLLLDNPEVTDLKIFTTQLYMNGGLLKSDFIDDLNSLAMKVRKLLAGDYKFCRESKLWLLLAVDISAVKYGLLPIEIQKFYQEQLSDKEMAAFQGLHNTLCVQTTLSSNKTLDKYQSNVNVLQVSTPPSESSSVNEIILSPSQSSSFNLNSSGFSSDTSQSYGRREPPTNQPQGKSFLNSENKSGRPILGAGARLNKNKLNNENSFGRKEHSNENSSGWNNKPPKSKPGTTNWSDSKKATNPSKSSNKGWEHDDRFENDY